MNKFSGETYAQMSNAVNIAFFEGNQEDFLYIINFQKVRKLTCLFLGVMPWEEFKLIFTFPGVCILKWGEGK